MFSKRGVEVGLVKRALSLLLTLALMVTLLSLAGTDEVKAQDQIPTRIMLTAVTNSPVVLGNTVKMEANLQDVSGAAIEGATVRFYRFASFLSGAQGLMEIGEAITDSNGVAALEYLSREEGDIQVTVVYEGDSQYASSQSSTNFLVGGDKQLYEAEAGIRVPFVGKWLLVAALSGIWATFLFVVTLVLRIALSPEE